MSTSWIVPVGSRVSNHDFDELDSDSYTAHRLKHASPEHLHLTTRRFFIGPVPEGWLNSHRKEWYKRRLQLSTYSSKQASFNAAENQGPHHRTMTGLQGSSTAARMSFSFPQPEDVDDQSIASETMHPEVDEEEEEDDVEAETRNIEPLSTNEVPQILGIADEEDGRSSKAIPVPPDKGMEGVGDPSSLSPQTRKKMSRSPGQDTFTTAQEDLPQGSRYHTPNLKAQDEGTYHYESDEQKFSSSNRESLLQPGGGGASDAGSRSPLLPSTSLEISPQTGRSAQQTITQHEPAPFDGDDTGTQITRSRAGVRFQVSEGAVNRQRRVRKRVDSARDLVAKKRFGRNTLREGTIVKMEKMLVRVDVTMQELPAEFDENESIKTETRTVEKWKEFMVVARKSKKQDSDDFRLQIYKTRVIPEIDDESTKKKPTREVRLDPKTTHVNLYSSLDKTVVVWHPYKKGNRIMIMRPCSTAHSVEWYTFLRDALGWHRPSTLKVNVPDLDVSLRLERPFEGLETAGADAADEETAMAKTIAAEQAVSGKIITQCIDMLEGDPEWTDVLRTWKETVKMGLAWKRYDRLEWVHGVNEQKMYGSMAMQQSHDLELRPKQHYPTTTYGKKGEAHEEPAPIEGFLIRLTSQKGVHQRLGKAFFKRLYFSTQNQFLMFNRPAKTTPPHPPRLATISRSNIPSSHEIVEKTPVMYDIEPFKTRDGNIAWLLSGNKDTIAQRDREAFEEARRNVANVSDSDGFIDMCHIVKVRTIKWGASPADENLEAGSDSDVDFHQEVENTTHEDGTTTEIDEERVFELVLDNGLVVRLQAFSKQTRDEWMHRLKRLVKYWKLRTAADMNTYKSVRRSNLEHLNIDEQMEAVVGQFARKWEVSRSEASPELYHMCGISSCRAVTMSGLLYRKPRRHATFQRCGVVLSGGQMLIYQATLRKRTGEQVKHIHQEKQQVIDLKDCYVYSGLIVEDDLLYQNRTFDANHPGMASLPRVYLEDGWTSADADVMTCFVVWMNRSKGWFRTATQDQESGERGGTRARIKRVGQLGVPGRGMVFKCRSRAERDHWVLAVSNEIERVVEREQLEQEGEEVRFLG